MSDQIGVCGHCHQPLYQNGPLAHIGCAIHTPHSWHQQQIAPGITRCPRDLDQQNHEISLRYADLTKPLTATV